MSDALALALFCAGAGALCCLMVALAEALDAWDTRWLTSEATLHEHPPVD